MDLNNYEESTYCSKINQLREYRDKDKINQYIPFSITVR